jgi:hypothetical protein
MAAPSYADPTSFFGTPVPKMWHEPHQRSRFGDVVLVAFLLAQCFDGVLTYIGVMTFGPGIEANPVIGALMLHFGHGVALTMAKVLSGSLGILLHMQNIHGAVAVLAGFYLTVAVLPWITILFF